MSSPTYNHSRGDSPASPCAICAMRAMAVKLRGNMFDEGMHGGTSNQPVDVARDLGYRAGSNDANRTAARMLDAEALKIEMAITLGGG